MKLKILLFIQEISFVNTWHGKFQRRFLRSDAVRRTSEISDNAGTYIPPRPSKMKTVNYTTVAMNTILPTTPMLNQQTVSLTGRRTGQSISLTRRFNPQEAYQHSRPVTNCKITKILHGPLNFQWAWFLFDRASSIR